jgi:hypothetical protein
VASQRVSFEWRRVPAVARSAQVGLFLPISRLSSASQRVHVLSS